MFGSTFSNCRLLMKLLWTMLCALCIAIPSFGQEISYDDFKSVIPFLQKEDFKGAFDQTSQLLNASPNDSSNLHGIVVYMNIFSAAGMVTLDQMSHDDFLKNANKFIGQRIVMPIHPCVDSASQGFNSLQFFTKDGQFQGMTIAANKEKTNILFFEYFKYAEPINPADLIGKNVRSGGTLASVEVNPNKSKIWISRLHIDQASSWDATPR